MVVWRSFAQWEVYFFLNGWSDFKRCYKTERAIGLNKIIALSEKLTRQATEFGHEKHLKWNHMRQLQLTLFYWPMHNAHNRKNANHFIGAFHCPSQIYLPFSRITHKLGNLIPHSSHLRSSRLIWWDAIVVIVNRRFVLIGRLFEIDLVKYMPHSLLSAWCDQINSTYTNKFKKQNHRASMIRYQTKFSFEKVKITMTPCSVINRYILIRAVQTHHASMVLSVFHYTQVNFKVFGSTLVSSTKKPSHRSCGRTVNIVKRIRKQWIIASELVVYL